MFISLNLLRTPQDITQWPLQESGLKVTDDHGEIKLLNWDVFQQYTFSLSSNPMRRQHDFFHLNYYKKILKRKIIETVLRGGIEYLSSKFGNLKMNSDQVLEKCMCAYTYAYTQEGDLFYTLACFLQDFPS